MNPDDYFPFKDEIDAEERFVDYLNTRYSLVRIGDLVFEPARVIRACSETSYRSMFNDWLNGERYA